MNDFYIEGDTAVNFKVSICSVRCVTTRETSGFGIKQLGKYLLASAGSIRYEGKS